MTSHSIRSGPAQARSARGLSGEIAPPGDKSISHRALILGGLASGVTRVRGLLESDDVLRTSAAMRALGARIKRAADGEWRVEGVGEAGLAAPQATLDFGNSGTGCRLVMGAAAGYPIEARFTGDESLRARPMERVLAPLRAFGAGAWCENDRLPVRIKGRRPLSAITWISSVHSAQVKSAALIAALAAEGVTEYVEARPTRDHTERMLALFGAAIETEAEGDRRLARVTGPVELSAADFDIPGDPSSAAFLLAAAAITPDSDVSIVGMLANPTRMGFLETLSEMGAELDFEEGPEDRYESVAGVTVRTSALTGLSVDPARAPSMIDEFPILAVVAAFADGPTRVTGVQELRVKESDRIAAIAAMLRANGVAVDETPDGFTVHGRGPSGVPGGGRVQAHGDHRIAMSALVMGLAARAPVEVDDAAMIATSYPRFFDDLRALGADIAQVTA